MDDEQTAPSKALLPCPFCGGAPQRDGGWLFCLDCGVGYEGTDETTTARWNRRASSEPTTEPAETFEAWAYGEGYMYVTSDPERGSIAKRAFTAGFEAGRRSR